MKKLVCLSIVLCILCVFVLSACNDAAAPTEQDVLDAAVQAKVEATQERTFSKPTEDDPAVAAREGDADGYVVQHNASGDSLIYIYEDIYYGSEPEVASSYRYIDVYTPVAKEKLDPDTPVFLYLHGGGWVAGNRKQERNVLMPYITSMGMVVVSMEYGLWFGLNQMDTTEKGVYDWESFGVMGIINTVLRNEHPVSVNDMMDDITACLTFLRDSYLPSLGLTATKIGIGGYSAGAHLSSLYAYRYGDKAPLGLGYLMDLVGPVKLIDTSYKRILDIATGHVVDNKGKAVDDLLDIVAPMLEDLAPALAGILGEEDPINIATEEGYQHALESIPQFQPIDYLTSSSLPTIICYARSHDKNAITDALFVGDYDNLVPVSVYEAISAKLDEVGIVHSDVIFDDLTHMTIGYSYDSAKWMATHIAAYAEIYCK